MRKEFLTRTNCLLAAMCLITNLLVDSLVFNVFLDTFIAILVVYHKYLYTMGYKGRDYIKGLIKYTGALALIWFMALVDYLIVILFYDGVPSTGIMLFFICCLVDQIICIIDQKTNFTILPWQVAALLVYFVRWEDQKCACS
ncbi:MAG: hypothetical protein IJ864_00010 [Alphaproteobacteria bacterium]|nr:hypothetical protein [Alphaproteobacteria bacterium]